MNVVPHVVATTIGALFMCAGTPVHALDPEAEFSRELEVRYRVNPETRLHAYQSLATDNLRSFKESALGLAVDCRLNKGWSYRIGARYIGRSEDDAEDQTKVEHRGIADITYARTFNTIWTLSNRNRVDLRWREGQSFSYRLRDRLMLERETHMFGKKGSWYMSSEVFRDSRYNGLARGRAVVGVSLALTPRIGTDLSYSITRDRTPTTNTFGSVGFAIVLQFDEPASELRR